MKPAGAPGQRSGSPSGRWRHYSTETGRKPVAQFLAGLTPNDRAEVWAAMTVIAERGLRDGRARHLDKQIWEVKAQGERGSYRVLFAEERSHGGSLLALEGFSKKSQKTPKGKIELAKQRLSDWRRRSTGQRMLARDRGHER